MSPINQVLFFCPNRKSRDSLEILIHSISPFILYFYFLFCVFFSFLCFFFHIFGDSHIFLNIEKENS